MSFICNFDMWSKRKGCGRYGCTLFTSQPRVLCKKPMVSNPKTYAQKTRVNTLSKRTGSFLSQPSKICKTSDNTIATKTLTLKFFIQPIWESAGISIWPYQAIAYTKYRKKPKKTIATNKTQARRARLSVLKEEVLKSSMIFIAPI